MNLKIAAIIAACLSLIAPADATQYSKLSIITATKAIGKWDGLKAWIEGAGFIDEWNAASYISDAYPQYAQITNAVVQSGVLTADELGRVMAASIDTALPDAMFNAMYDRDMSNETGRVKWHGNVSRTRFDTNALVKTTWYSDGYEFSELFKVKRPPSVQSQLTAAERKALIEKQKAEAQARIAAKKQARIDLLTTNLTAEVSALMARRQWPEELARLFLLDELNKLKGTVEVAPTITPQN